ncbi:hypothetical protein [Enterococcus mundtii]
MPKVAPSNELHSTLPGFIDQADAEANTENQQLMDVTCEVTNKVGTHQ